MNTLPTKWAVAITSQQDAERLQELFPNAKNKMGAMFLLTYLKNAEDGILYFAKHPEYSEYWAHVINKANFHDYTILSIKQLENLLK